MIDLAELREALREADLDGWLLFDFHGLNPVATRVLGLTGMNTRRLFALLPRQGEPVAIAHKIELQGLENFPGRVVPYARWSELHAGVGPRGRGQDPGMEISPRNAVPYLDRVPHGVVRAAARLGANDRSVRRPGLPLCGAMEPAGARRTIVLRRRFWPTWRGDVARRRSGRLVRSPKRRCRRG